MKTVTPSALTEITALVNQDICAVDALITSTLTSAVPLIQTIIQHILTSGGKRLRPLVVLLSAHATGYHQTDTEHHELATIIEFIHTATLLHDDVVDASSLRRGHPTANIKWGNQASVLVGDFLYSRAFQILAKRSNVAVMATLATTTNHIAEGEVWQLSNQHDATIDEPIYFAVIQRKTAKLFSAAAEIGAIISTPDIAIQQTMANFGLHLGMAYQIIDDLLDYAVGNARIGKNIGDDLSEGKATLPLIYAKQHATPAEKKYIETAIHQGGLNNFQEILQIIETTGARSYTLRVAQQHAEKAKHALQMIPASPYRNGLERLADFVVERDY